MIKRLRWWLKAPIDFLLWENEIRRYEKTLDFHWLDVELLNGE